MNEKTYSAALPGAHDGEKTLAAPTVVPTTVCGTAEPRARLAATEQAQALA